MLSTITSTWVKLLYFDADGWKLLGVD